MGFGIIKIVNKKMEFVQMNELLLNKYKDPYVKLKLIFERTIELIDTYHPDEIALEAPFFGKNVQSMLKLGRAQGVAMAAGLSRQIPVTEYLPKKIKMAIANYFNIDILEFNISDRDKVPNEMNPTNITLIETGKYGIKSVKEHPIGYAIIFK